MSKFKDILMATGDALGVTDPRKANIVEEDSSKSLKEEFEDAAKEFVADDNTADSRVELKEADEEAFVDESDSATKAPEPATDSDATKSADAPADTEANAEVANASADDATKSAESSAEYELGDGVKEVIENAEAEREKMREAHQRTLDILKPVEPISEEENIMQPRNFYDEIGDLAYEFDRSGDLDSRLADYVKSVIARDGSLIEEFLTKNICDVIVKNPQLIPQIDETIRGIAEASVDIVYRYRNIVDVDDNDLYESFEEAKSSISTLTERYGVDPSNVFQITWFKVKENGKLGAELSRDEVEKYISEFRGDKAALRKKLCVPKKETKKDNVGSGKATKSGGSGKSAKNNNASTTTDA